MAGSIALTALLAENLSPVVGRPVHLLGIGLLEGPALLAPVGGRAPEVPVDWEIELDGDVLAEGTLLARAGVRFSFATRWTPARAGIHLVRAVVDPHRKLEKVWRERADNARHLELHAVDLRPVVDLGEVPFELGRFRVDGGFLGHAPAPTGAAAAARSPAAGAEPGAVDWATTAPAMKAAAVAAIRRWIAGASLKGKVVGPAAAFAPGALRGEEDLGTSLCGALLDAGVREDVAALVADVTAAAWDAWVGTWTFLHPAAFPPFAAWPAPAAPPLMATPFNLAAGTCPGLPAMAAAPLAAALREGLDALAPLDAPALVADDYACWLAFRFHAWLAATLVSNVVGQGTVPSFAPPYVPLGPVLGDAEGHGVLLGPPF